MQDTTGNAPLSNQVYGIGNGTTNTDPFITVFSTRNPNSNDINFPVKKRWINFTTPVTEWVLQSFTNSTGQITANWVLLSSGSSPSVEDVMVDVAVAPGVNPVSPDPATDIVKFGQNLGSTHTPINTGTTAAAYQTVTRNLYEMGIELQLCGSNPAILTANNFGISQFDSNQFDVVAGFVQLKGNGVNPALTKLGMDTGTSPVVPDATGLITLTAGTVLAGTNPIRTDGTGANTAKIEVQISQALAATDATKIGLSNFDSAQFTVDANGFVQITNFSPFNYVQVTHNGTNPSPYTVTSTDYYISCDTTSATAGTITILLPNAPTTLRQFTIKDRTGGASINNITVTTVGGVVTIDGATSYTMAGNFDAINLLFNGSSYEIY